MRRDSPAITSRRGRGAAENMAFFASLWEQSRAVASLLNAKLLRSSDPPGGDRPAGAEAETQWRRHRAFFLATPRAAAGLGVRMAEDDAFFGPEWHRRAFAAEEMLTYACVAEGRWRRWRDAVSSSGGGASAPSPSYHQPAAPWSAYAELAEATVGLRIAVRRHMKMGDARDWPGPSAGPGRRFVGSIVAGAVGFGTMRWRLENEAKKDHRAMALDYVLHALDLLDENISLSGAGVPAEVPETPPRHPDSSARLHYLAARLLMGMDDPTAAVVHLKIAAEQTRSWPSLHVSVQRALFACEERCAAVLMTGPVESRAELLLRPGTCRLLSTEEAEDAQDKAWGGTSSGELVWNHDDSSKTEPPFEVAVSFPRSTHATSGDPVAVFVSIRSCLGFQVRVESVRLVTTSGTYGIPNLDRCMLEELRLRSRQAKRALDGGVLFDTGNVAFFLTEIDLPSNLSNIPLGGASADTSKFIPKNARLCNMGFSHAAGNICEPRFEDWVQHKISINGKPVVLSSVPESATPFIGGIPLTCHGAVLTLKRADVVLEDTQHLRLQIDRPRLVSPLLRSGTQQLSMEECNYTAHSWSRPAHHPWCLGPRVLRVLGPRPHMTVTNLTESQTDGKAVEGTVNRVMFRISAGNNEDCWDVRVRLKCLSVAKRQQPDESNDETTPKDELIDIEPIRMPTFVQASSGPTGNIVTQNRVMLPEGWEPRRDVSTESFTDTATSTVCRFLGAGKSLLFPLDVFRTLDQSLPPKEGGVGGVCSTSYEVIITYRQVRAGKIIESPEKMPPGDQVLVVQNGSIEWIPPLATGFSLTNGPAKPYPWGVQHASNAAVQALTKPPPTGGNEIIAADGERVLMRCTLKASEFGSYVAAIILNVKNEIEGNESRKVLYSSDSGLFMNQGRQGSHLSLSYSVLATGEAEPGNNTIHLGVITVYWKPFCLPQLDMVVNDTASINDGFELCHGPLSLPNLTPMVFYGPRCRVLNAPFEAKLLRCPSTPKVGAPFSISYWIKNRTAKSQTLILCLNDSQEVDRVDGPPSDPRLLCAGKLKEETQMAPFEERIFSFAFMSMAAGRVIRPPLAVSSGRHKTWVVNEGVMSSRHLFVMP